MRDNNMCHRLPRNLAAALILCTALLVGCGGGGNDGNQVLPGGEIAITASSFAPGVYQGTFNDTDGSLGIGPSTGAVVWNHTSSGNDKFTFVPNGSDNLNGHLVIASNASPYLINGTLTLSKPYAVIVNSFVPGTFQCQGPPQGSDPFTFSLSLQHS